ncbi:response regulator transcription factor [Pleurocapsa sp. PCC 7319]|uniref:response regulator transcription factor n=1 Tax=Pleurocapsa sp. PCC 7319 TaxID=118161 RepID=UPI0003456088|nr:response regulator transcription factor [Pleurocapsa sp. PCC 7319]
MNILVVVDDLSRWLKLAQFLRAANYTPRLAENSLDAINIFPEADLIMVDAELSSGGVELCRELRCRGYSRPLLLMALESLDDVRLSGADDWIEFPFYGPEIALKVELLLTRYQLWTMGSQTNPSFYASFCTIDSIAKSGKPIKNC